MESWILCFYTIHFFLNLQGGIKDKNRFQYFVELLTNMLTIFCHMFDSSYKKGTSMYYSLNFHDKLVYVTNFIQTFDFLRR